MCVFSYPTSLPRPRTAPLFGVRLRCGTCSCQTCKARPLLRAEKICRFHEFPEFLHWIWKSKSKSNMEDVVVDQGKVNQFLNQPNMRNRLGIVCQYIFFGSISSKSKDGTSWECAGEAICEAGINLIHAAFDSCCVYWTWHVWKTQVAILTKLLDFDIVPSIPRNC